MPSGTIAFGRRARKLNGGARKEFDRSEGPLIHARILRVLANARFGSEADMCGAARCPLWARSGLMKTLSAPRSQCSSQAEYNQNHGDDKMIERSWVDRIWQGRGKGDNDANP